MKKLLFLFSLLVFVNSYGLSPSFDSWDNDVGITYQLEDVQPELLAIEFVSLDLSLEGEYLGSLGIFSDLDLIYSDVSIGVYYDYIGPRLLDTIGIIKLEDKVPSYNIYLRKDTNKIIGSAGGLSA